MPLGWYHHGVADGVCSLAHSNNIDAPHHTSCRLVHFFVLESKYNYMIPRIQAQVLLFIPYPDLTSTHVSACKLPDLPKAKLRAHLCKLITQTLPPPMPPSILYWSSYTTLHGFFSCLYSIVLESTPKFDEYLEFEYKYNY